MLDGLIMTMMAILILQYQALQPVRAGAHRWYEMISVILY